MSVTELPTERPHPLLGRTLAECMAQGHDNFALLRLLAAALVIFGHSWATAVNPSGATDWLGQQTLVFSGTVAVDIFFWVSGFLVTMSFHRKPRLLDFARARILRIFPGLIVCVLFCALVLGALCTTLAWSEYYRHPDVWRYVYGNGSLLELVWFLPGVFEQNVHKGVVNGSLWTLPGEICMYLYVLGLGALGLLANARRFGLALAALLAVFFLVPAVNLVQQAEYREFAAFFAFGAFCYFHREALPVSGYLVLLLAFFALSQRGQPGYTLVFGAFVAYACVWFAYGPRLPSPERLGDYSYGLYLYGFPMQQLVAMWWPEWGPWRSLLLSLPMALVLAVASWHWVEKPMLRFKRRQNPAGTGQEPAVSAP